MLTNQKGFTLLEIIAVLIILGILMAVAMPKYFDLQEIAKDKTMDAVLAEGVGRIHMYFGKKVIGGSTPGQIVYSDATLGADAGDFTFTYLNGGSGGTADILVTATGKPGTALPGQTKSRTVNRPGTD